MSECCKMNVDMFSTKELFASTTYVISSEKWVIVIDPWFYQSELKFFLHKLWKVDVILLTHGHADHVRDVDKIVEDFPWTKVYIHEDDVDLLSDINLNCSKLVWNCDIIVKSKVESVGEWTMNLAGYKVQIIHTPWHTNGCAMYYFEDEKLLFLWDTILWESIGTMSIPTWNEWLMYKSLEKVKQFWFKDNVMTYSGHWDVMKYWDLLKINNFL